MNPAIATELKKLRVLVIDDEQDVRTIAEFSLQCDRGMEVSVAAGALEALRQMTKSMPDVILLDSVMPVFDGPTTLRLLKADPATRGIPVIFMTGRTSASETRHAMEGGAMGVIAKPFKPSELPGKVRSMMKAPAAA